VIFYEQKLYADMGRQLIYAVISLYGWYHWRFGGTRRTVLRVSRTPPPLRPILPVLWLAGSVGLGWLLARWTDHPVPYADAALTAGSLIAQWMMTRKYLGNWTVWILLDVAYVAVFINRGLHLTAFLYAVFLVLAARGRLEWRRSLEAQAAAAA
jgi:nicotinamide mononucleotide transporter